MLQHLIKFFTYLIFLSTALQAAEPKDNLELSEIHHILGEMLQQHLDKKEVDEKMLTSAFRLYLEQFDPEKIYLLDKEVRPYLDPNAATSKQFLAQYKEQNYTAFENLNQLIQQAIERARSIRTSLEKNPAPYFEEAKKMTSFSKDDYLDKTMSRPYAKTLDELKKRIEQDFTVFIKEEMVRFGEAAVLQKQAQIIKFYAVQMDGEESSYLFVDDQGKPLNAKEKEHVFVLHILKALAKSLDSHSSFFSPEEASEMKMRLEKGYNGIGIVFQEGIDGVVVTNIIPNSPADRLNKVKVNDQLISINGKPIANESFTQVMDMIRGEVGTPITLELKRKVVDNNKKSEQKVNITLNRERITLDEDRVDYSYEQFGDGIIGKIVLYSFYQNPDGISSENDVREAIRKLRQRGQLRGLILDMRDNSGGYLSQAIKVAGLFITSGVIVISKYSDGEKHVYRDLDNKDLYDGPLVILTSRLTASAAEIVAQALQDYGVAIIVGDDHTYGKGSIQSQTVTDKNSSSYFKVTVGKYYTVSGKSPQKYGVFADIVVPSQYSKDAIGESFLRDTLSTDTINAEYNDELEDVRPEIKAWYMKYYLPTLQPKETVWKKMIPTLKKNSEYRISKDKNYQLFLKKLVAHKEGKEPPPEDESEEDTPDSEEEGRLRRKNKDFGSQDLQMVEATNIVKDMIILETDLDQNFVGTH
jgi:carboxyl-terminal processing protease